MDTTLQLRTLVNHGHWKKASRILDHIFSEATRQRYEMPPELKQLRENVRHFRKNRAKPAAPQQLDAKGNPMVTVSVIEGVPFVCLTGLWVHFGADRELDPLDWFMRTVSEYPGRTLLLDGNVWAEADLATEYLERLGYRLPEQGLAPVIDLASRRKAGQA